MSIENQIVESDEAANARGRRVSVKNASRSFAACSDNFPPILSLKQAAALALIAPSTLKRKISEGQFKFCVSRRKPLRIWRDKFVVELFAEARR